MPIRDVVNTGSNASAVGLEYRLRDMAADHLLELLADDSTVTAGDHVDDITATAGLLPLLPDGAAEAAAKWVATHPVFDVDALVFEGSTPQLINAIRGATSPTSDLNDDAKSLILTLELAAKQYEADAVRAAQKEVDLHFASDSEDDMRGLRQNPHRRAWLADQQLLRQLEYRGSRANELMEAAAYTKTAAAAALKAALSKSIEKVEPKAKTSEQGTASAPSPPAGATGSGNADGSRPAASSSSSSIPQALKPSSSSGKL